MRARWRFGRFFRVTVGKMVLKGVFQMVFWSFRSVPGCLVHSYWYQSYWKHAPVARVSQTQKLNWNQPAKQQTTGTTIETARRQSGDCSSFVVYLLVWPIMNHTQRINWVYQLVSISQRSIWCQLIKTNSKLSISGSK